MVDAFDRHLENLGITGWVVMILLSLVVYLYDENKSLKRSKDSTITYLIAKHETEIKMLMENKKEPVKTLSKPNSQGSYVDCDFEDTIPF
jgi:hypothetical protein